MLIPILAVQTEAKSSRSKVLRLSGKIKLYKYWSGRPHPAFKVDEIFYDRTMRKVIFAKYKVRRNKKHIYGKWFPTARGMSIQIPHGRRVIAVYVEGITKKKDLKKIEYRFRKKSWRSTSFLDDFLFVPSACAETTSGRRGRNAVRSRPRPSGATSYSGRRGRNAGLSVKKRPPADPWLFNCVKAGALAGVQNYKDSAQSVASFARKLWNDPGSAWQEVSDSFSETVDAVMNIKSTTVQAIDSFKKTIADFSDSLAELSPKEKRDLICKTVTEVITTAGPAVLAGVGTAKVGKAVKDALEKQVAKLKKEKEEENGKKPSAIASNKSASRTDRASHLFGGKKISANQAKAIEMAHKVGDGQLGADKKTPARFENYTPAQLKEKMRILKSAGFSGKESQQLIRAGIAGAPNRSVAQAIKQGALYGDDLFVSIPTNKGVKYGRIVEQKPGDGVVVEYQKSDGSFGKMPIPEGDVDALNFDSGAKSVKFTSPSFAPGEAVVIARSSGQLQEARIMGVDGDDVRVFFRDKATGQDGIKTVSRQHLQENFGKVVPRTPNFSQGEKVVIARSSGQLQEARILGVDGDNVSVMFKDSASGLEAMKVVSRKHIEEHFPQAGQKASRSEVKRGPPSQPSASRQIAGMFQGMPSHQVSTNVVAQKPVRVKYGQTETSVKLNQAGASRSREITSFSSQLDKPLPEGYYTYGIRDDGSLVVGRVRDQLENGVKHINIADGDKFQVAGELHVTNQGYRYNTESGSYSRHIAKELGENGNEILADRAGRSLEYYMGGRGQRDSRGTFFNELPAADLGSYCRTDKVFFGLNKAACCKLAHVCD